MLCRGGSSDSSGGQRGAANNSQLAADYSVDRRQRGTGVSERFIQLWDEGTKTRISTPIPEEIADLLEPYGKVYQKLCTWIGGISDCEVPSGGDYAEMRNYVFGIVLEAFQRGQKTRPQ
jgi:hypothetical protein